MTVAPKYYLSYLGSLVIAAVISQVPTAARAINVFLDYTDFDTRLGELTTSATVDPFSVAEVTTIRSTILSELNTVFSDYDVNFSETNPGGTFETITFGDTDVPGSLGVAPLDYLNLFTGETAQVFTANFDFIIDEFSGSTNRDTQISQLSVALAGTGAHELGHTFGLQHHDAYGDPAITTTDGTTPITTGGQQNTHIIATGSTGIDEVGRETSRTFSEYENAKLEFTGGADTIFFGSNVTNNELVATPITTLLETGATQTGGQALTFNTLTVSDLVATSVIGQLSSAGEVDTYTFTGGLGRLLTVEVLSEIRFENPIDSLITLIDPDGLTVATNDDLFYSGNTFQGGTLRSTDSLLLNLQLTKTGTYTLEVEDLATDTGLYSLFVASDVPEPSTILGTLAAVGLGAALMWKSRQRQIQG